jgi:nucleoside-diphosphate-sugar epimerase
MTEQQRVAVTGAGGFLGSVLVRQLLADGVNVLAVSRRNLPPELGVTALTADIRDSARLAAAFKGIDAIFHLAAHVHDLSSHDDSAQQQAITLGGTRAVLEAAERSGVRQVILASSLAVFGEVGCDLVNEEHPCRPTTPYGRAKLESEEALHRFTQRTGATGAAIRPAMMYGVPCPGNLPRMIRAVRSGWFPPIPEFGNRRSMVSVEDAATAFRLAWFVGAMGGRPYIVTDGHGYSTRHLYDLICRALGRETSALAIPRFVFWVAARMGDLGGRLRGQRLPFDSRALERLAGSAWFDSSRAQGELGFRPTASLPDLMPALVESVVRKA